MKSFLVTRCLPNVRYACTAVECRSHTHTHISSHNFMIRSPFSRFYYRLISHFLMAQFFPFKWCFETHSTKRYTNLPKRDARNVNFLDAAESRKPEIVNKMAHLVKAERKCDARRLCQAYHSTCTMYAYKKSVLNLADGDMCACVNIAPYWKCMLRSHITNCMAFFYKSQNTSFLTANIH